MRYGAAYKLQMRYKNHAYGIRQTTNGEHYNCEGYLYGGKDEPPNIQVVFHAGEALNRQNIGSWDHVVPHFFTLDSQSLGTITDSDDIIRLVHPASGDTEPELMNIEEIVSFDFHDVTPPSIEYYDLPKSLTASTHAEALAKHYMREDGTQVKNTLEGCQFLYIWGEKEYLILRRVIRQAWFYVPSISL